MTRNLDRLVTARDVARVLFRHRRKMLVTFFGVIGLTLVAIAFFPRQYASEAKLFLRFGRESVALDPTATTGQVVMLQKMQDEEINSAREILTSREVLERVVETVGADTILKDDESGDSSPDAEPDWSDRISIVSADAWSWVNEALVDAGLMDPGTELDRAVRQLQKRMRVTAPKQSTVLTVRYTARTPELAREVVRATTDTFREYHVKLSRTEGSHEFFAAQVDESQEELSAARAELRDRKSEFQLVTVDSRRSILEEQIKDVELQLLDAQREIAFAEGKSVELTRVIASLDPEIITDRRSGYPNEARDSMRQKLYELELQESELAARYTETHPLVLQIRKRREDALRILEGQPEERTQTTAALNANQRALELELLQARSSRDALRARQRTAQSQHERLYGELQTLNEQEFQINHLERTVDVLEEKYRLHVSKLEEARVNDALQRQRITNVNVAQPATLVHKPAAPNKLILLLLGLAVATGGSAALALVGEFFDQTLRTSDQVAAELGLPVLMSLPYRKRKRRSAKKVNGAGDDANGHEHYRRYAELAQGLLASSNGHGRPKTVGIVGCDATKQRSRVAANLAMHLASTVQDSVLLIDADARRRRVARRFSINGSPGWREVLAGEADSHECVHHRPKLDRLAIMAPGRTNGRAKSTDGHDAAVEGNGHAAPAATNGTIEGQLDAMKSEYGLIVVDLPPVREMGAPTAPAEWLDEAVLVVEAERTRIQTAQRAKEMLERAGVHLKGVVLTNRREHIPRWLYRRL